MAARMIFNGMGGAAGFLLLPSTPTLAASAAFQLCAAAALLSFLAAAALHQRDASPRFAEEHAGHEMRSRLPAPQGRRGYRTAAVLPPEAECSDRKQ